MFKKLKVIVLLAIIVSGLTVTAQALEPSYIPVRVKFNGGEIKVFDSAAETVGEFLQERRIKTEGTDRVVPSVESEITAGIIIEIDFAFDMKVIIDGEETTLREPVMSVAELVGRIRKDTGLDIRYDTNLWARKTYEGMTLELKSYRTELIEEREQVEFDRLTVYNEEEDEGVETVLSEGQKGYRTIVTEIEYLGNEEVGRTVLSDEITDLPVHRVVEIGTKKPNLTKTLSGSAFEYESVMTMIATAYTSDFASTGKNPGDRGFGITASGMKAQVGVVAVDPGVIPLGTRLYIDGYGYAVAGDTGGAIKGNKIDLYFDTNSECMNYGRRQTTVYVLKD